MLGSVLFWVVVVDRMFSFIFSLRASFHRFRCSCVCGVFIWGGGERLFGYRGVRNRNPSTPALH